MFMKNGKKWITMMLVAMLILVAFASIGQAKRCLPKPKSYLKIDAPSEVDEGENFDVFVTIERITAIQAKPEPAVGATVITEWDNSTYLTDEQGKVTIIAPLVDDDIISNIIAIKEGYESDIVPITIINIFLSQLKINAPSEVDEGSDFGVVITADNQTIPSVTVIFNDEVKITDDNGSVSFTAPK